MAEPTSVVSICGVTYVAPEVHVAMVGIKGKETMMQTIKVDAPVTVGELYSILPHYSTRSCARYSTHGRVRYIVPLTVVRYTVLADLCAIVLAVIESTWYIVMDLHEIKK